MVHVVARVKARFALRPLQWKGKAGGVTRLSFCFCPNWPEPRYRNMDGAVKQTFRTATIWIGIAAAAFVLWQAREAVLIAFGGIMLAILLHVLASGICRIFPLSDAWGLLFATLLVLLLIVLCVWLFGTNLGGQLQEVIRQARTGIQQLQSTLSRNGVNSSVLTKGTSFVGTMIPNVLKYSVRFAEVAIIVAVTAIYLAAQPDMYRRGAALLFPERLRPKAMEAVSLIGSSLRLWMLGQLLLMVVVGLLSYFAVLLLGLPNPGALGLIAGITEIVPYLGPFIGGVPAVLVALTQNSMLAVYTTLAYLGVHVIEGYLIGPLLQRWFVLIPPALILTGIFASQLLFGFAGIILAAPVTVAVFAAVKVLYMRDTLKQDVEMPEKPPI